MRQALFYKEIAVNKTVPALGDYSLRRQTINIMGEFYHMLRC